MTIGQKIKNERLLRKMSQEEVAKYIGTTKQAVYKYENEIVTNIPTDKIYKLAQLFNTTPAYLMGWETQNAPAQIELSEDEKMVLAFFRQIPESKQKQFVEMTRLFANSLKDNH